MNKSFVFFHVGDDASTPTMLVDSIRWSNPDAEIIFCTDEGTPDISGVDKRVKVNGDRSLLMTYRLKAFANCEAEGPAVYLDTDMLVIRAIDPVRMLGAGELALCHRSFNNNSAFNGNFRGLDFREYDQMPLGVVYPYVACCTVTREPRLWQTLLDLLLQLNPKFHHWYGDQEAMKRYAADHGDRITALPESVYGCLPEARDHLASASILHFKGPRKPAMAQAHAQIRAQVGARGQKI